MRLLALCTSVRFILIAAHVANVIVLSTLVEASEVVSAQQPVLSSPLHSNTPRVQQTRPIFLELTSLVYPDSPSNDHKDEVVVTESPPSPLPRQPPPPYSMSRFKHISGVGGYAFTRLKMGMGKGISFLGIVWYPLSVIGTVFCTVVAICVLKYRRSIKKRVIELNDMSMTDLMVRVKDPKNGTVKFKLLELDPAFRDKYKDKWRLQSMGEYLSTLRPAVLPEGVDAPKFVQREMERFLAAALIDNLGPNIGSAVLPMMGFSNIQSTTACVAARVANWFASQFLASVPAVEDNDPSLDKGTFPFSLYDLSAFANLNEKFGSGNMKKTPLELMKHGEVGKSSTFDDELIPNVFEIDRHWDRALRVMASNMTEKNADFDPYDRSLAAPTPVNPRLFPDLHLGWGDAKCTHTNREIIRHRLLCILLNRLNYNIYNKEQGIKEEFVIVMDGKKLKSAYAFVEALMDSGHELEVCPEGNFTTFGIGACVKEKDNSFTNIPLAYFVNTGYENAEGRPAHVGMPHSGMSLSIKGPLVGKSNNCNIQFFMAIEGMCGWNSNHNADVPWVVPNASTEPYSREDSLRAVRLASLLAVTFNAIGTEMNLPFGGYGVLGVCNDTAALLDQSIRGKTNIYPLISTGRFLMHTAKRLGILRKNLLKHTDLSEEVSDILRMVAATMDIPSDLHAAPSNVMDASIRYLSCLGKTAVFQLEAESKKIITDTLEKFEDYGEKRPEMEKGWNWKKMRSRRKAA